MNVLANLQVIKEQAHSTDEEHHDQLGMYYIKVQS